MNAVDSLSLQVFSNLFASVAEEMGVTLQRASYSPNIKMRRDFSCAVFDTGGRLRTFASSRQTLIVFRGFFPEARPFDRLGHSCYPCVFSASPAAEATALLLLPR